MTVLIRLILALLLLGVSVQALESILPPDSLTSNFSTNFGCGIATDSSRLAIYSPSSPQREDLDGWRGVTLSAKPGSNDWELESTFETPAATGSSYLGDSQPCSIDIKHPYVVVGEPWVNHNRGRVIIRNKVSAPPSLSVTDILAEGREMNDRFGESVAVTGHWLVAGSPGADAVVIFQMTSSGYVEHSRLEGADFGGVNLASLSIGYSVSVSDSWLVIGAPATPGFAVPGVVLVFAYSDAEDSWTLYQVIQASSEANSATFGAIVRVGIDNIYISSPGSSTDTGTVSLYRHGAHREFALFGVLKGVERGDDFGRAIAGSNAALAVSQAGTSGRPHPSVHVYLKCGSSNVNAIHTVVKPDEGLSEWDYRWGRALAWSNNKLLIAATGKINSWNIPSLKAGSCGGSVGIFPAAECCYEGGNVVMSHTTTGLTIPSESSPSSAELVVDAPVRIYEPVTFLSTAILAIDSKTNISVDGHVKFAGKLKVRLPKPTGSASIHLDRMISYTSKEGAFSDVALSFTSNAATSVCDKISILPIYGMEALSLVITFTTASVCNPSSRPSYLPIFFIVGIAMFLVGIIALLMWKCPRLRNMISARPTRQGMDDYRHTRLATSEAEAEQGEVNELSDAYANYPEDGYDIEIQSDDDAEESDPELDFH